MQVASSQCRRIDGQTCVSRRTFGRSMGARGGNQCGVETLEAEDPGASMESLRQG